MKLGVDSWLMNGDALECLQDLPPDSVDALVTDPPAGIAFMGKEWDKDKGGRDAWVEWMTGVMRECYRVLKPGAHGFVWALPRTSHWTAWALEEAGFEIRDCVSHIFGSGFPKSMDVSKAIDKAAGAEREVTGRYEFPDGGNRVKPRTTSERVGQLHGHKHTPITAPATHEAKQWSGWGTALKPSVEKWWLIRKPLSEKTVVKNVLRHGTGALNIDASRVESDGGHKRTFQPTNKNRSILGKQTAFQPTNAEGRFPSNLIVSGSARDALDEQSGESKSVDRPRNNKPSPNLAMSGANTGHVSHGHSDSGGASRFFFDGADPFLYCAKASKRERNAGLDKFNNAVLDSSQWDVASTEAGVLLLRAILGSMPNLSIAESGDLITVTSPRDTLSITRTTIRQITESKILSWLTPLPTSDCIQDANSETAHGGSLAQCAKNLSALMNRIGTLPEKDGSLLVDAAHAISKSLLSLSKESAWKPQSNNHPTIKSQRLMRYLCKMICPPNGVVLDPFMGSGSTGVACAHEGFKFIGIDAEKEYVEIARARIEGTNPEQQRMAGL